MQSRSAHHFRLVFCALLCIVLLSLVIGLCWGTYQITPWRILQTLLGNGTKLEHITVFTIRLPRLLVAMLVGVALAISGGILQTVTQNDLADASMIGINAGAALAAVLFITMQSDVYYRELGGLAVYILPFAAMLGAMLAALILYLLAYRQGIRPQRLLLTGIGINIAINAIVIFVNFRGSITDYNRILIWTSGSLWGSGWKYFWVILPIVILIVSAVLYHHKRMDLLNLGDEVAVGLGVNVEKERKKLLTFAVLLAGAATAVAGNIGFLGLLAPHLAKKMVGPAHKYFLPAAACIGMIIIILADSMSRNVFSPIEIPVGITISLLGVPYFIYLMVKE